MCIYTMHCLVVSSIQSIQYLLYVCATRTCVCVCVCAVEGEEGRRMSPSSSLSTLSKLEQTTFTVILFSSFFSRASDE